MNIFCKDKDNIDQNRIEKLENYVIGFSLDSKDIWIAS